MTEDFLSISRDKWRELPSGSNAVGRVYSEEMMTLDDAALLARWQELSAGARRNERAWFQDFYAQVLAGKRIIEVGSGFGFDGIHFLKHGAHWTFSDLVPGNLAVVRRLVELQGLGARANYVIVENKRSYAALSDQYDAVWAMGSLHHAPFEIARVESLDLLAHLKPGGRWMELVYPFRRWQRQGSLPFTQFGHVTDGDRTPWAEWYDVAKLKRRLFPALTTTLLDFPFAGSYFHWIDLRIDAPNAGVGMEDRPINVMRMPLVRHNGPIVRKRSEIRIECLPQEWLYAGHLDLTPAIRSLGAPALPGLGYAVDLEMTVDRGCVSVLLTGTDNDDFLGHEQFIDAGPWRERVTVETFADTVPANLLFRNAASNVASRARILSASLRFAAQGSA
jgi:SAM-dependent methyltransferase